MIFLDFIYLLSMTIWIGSIVFFCLWSHLLFSNHWPKKGRQISGINLSKVLLVGIRLFYPCHAHNSYMFTVRSGLAVGAYSDHGWILLISRYSVLTKGKSDQESN